MFIYLDLQLFQNILCTSRIENRAKTMFWLFFVKIRIFSGNMSQFAYNILHPTLNMSLVWAHFAGWSHISDATAF